MIPSRVRYLGSNQAPQTRCSLQASSAGGVLSAGRRIVCRPDGQETSKRPWARVCARGVLERLLEGARTGSASERLPSAPRIRPNPASSPHIRRAKSATPPDRVHNGEVQGLPRAPNQPNAMLYSTLLGLSLACGASAQSPSPLRYQQRDLYPSIGLPR